MVLVAGFEFSRREVVRIAAIAISGAVLFAGAAPVAAQTSALAPPAVAASKTADPNQVVCEKQEVTGSRLGTKRVCMTRAEWADLRSQDRQEIEKVQVRRGMNGQ
jgi:invasion protein IalB